MSNQLDLIQISMMRLIIHDTTLVLQLQLS